MFVRKDDDTGASATPSECSFSCENEKGLNLFGEVVMKRSSDQRELSDGAPTSRLCILKKTENEDHGFFLAIDRDRNGQVIRRYHF